VGQQSRTRANSAAQLLQRMALTSLPNIPPELISCILQYLSPHDIISCQRTCRTLYNLCNDSNLRYLVQMERCGVNDDLRHGLCYPDRLRILEKRENAWAMLDFRKPIQVCVPFDSTGIYDFTGGAFLLGTRLYSASRRPTIGYSYVSLPSVSEEEENQTEVQWMGLNLGIQILDVGLAVHEHDLIAALTACVFPLFSSYLESLDFREGKRTMVVHQIGA
jgi:hypothetical protein